MSRKPRNLKPNYCCHVTTRCNNREFKLIRHECREVFLYALKKAREKFKFKLYALCIMSNHGRSFNSTQNPVWSFLWRA
ncbi:MAG: transposase [Xenococcaceae cyanobacterium MO_188.B32]|nr:transposase [Xenococcaceae cyanobacterium MO_188.B32]